MLRTFADEITGASDKLYKNKINKDLLDLRLKIELVM